MDDTPHVRRVDTNEDNNADRLDENKNKNSATEDPFEKPNKKGKGKGKSDEDGKSKSDDKDGKDGEKRSIKKDIDKFKKTAKKIGKTGAMVGKASFILQALQMAKALMMLLLNMIITAAQAVVGGILGLLITIYHIAVNALHAAGTFFAGAISSLGSFLGVGAAAATSIVVTGTATVLVGGAVIVSSIFGGSANDPAQWDTGIEDCAIAYNQIQDLANMDQDDMAAIQLEHAKKIFSIYKTYGLSNEQIAGMLGNWSVESGIDCSGVEGIFGEPYQIGPKKQAALDDHDAYTQRLIANYRSNGTPINERQYISANDGLYWMGLGIAQFTPGDKVVIPAQEMGMQWWDMDFQMAFILATGTSTTTGAKGGKQFFNNYMQDMNGASPEECAEYFLINYEGCPGDKNKAKRLTEAANWNAQLSNWDVDNEYANKIISIAEQLGAVAADNAMSNAKSRCVKMGKYDNSTIALAASSFAWPTKEQGKGNDGTELYQQVFVGLFGDLDREVYPRQDCGRCVSSAVLWSGADIDYPGSGTEPNQLPYLLSSPKWQLVGWMGDLRPEELQPGDVGIVEGHTWLFVGNEAVQAIHGPDNTGDCVSASLRERSPGVGKDANWYFSQGGRDPNHGLKEYRIFRLVQPDNSDKYSNIGQSGKPEEPSGPSEP